MNIFSFFKKQIPLFKNKFKINNIKQISIPLSLTFSYFYLKQKNNQLYAKDNIKLSKFYLPNTIRDLKENEYVLIPKGRKETENILVIKQNEKFYAISNMSPYSQTPLHKGLILKGIIKCNITGSTFDLNTGVCEIGPSMDDINSYDVVQENNSYYILHNSDNNLQLPYNFNQKMPLVKRDINNKQKFIIIGGGPAGLTCAETLRRSGFTVNYF
jgi:nitrite reductase/ring-hydroxylating ferredoxin subunit